MNEPRFGKDFLLPETTGSPTPEGFERYTYLVFRKSDGRFLYECPVFCKSWATFYDWLIWKTETDKDHYYEM